MKDMGQNNQSRLHVHKANANRTHNFCDMLYHMCTDCWYAEASKILFKTWYTLHQLRWCYVRIMASQIPFSSEYANHTRLLGLRQWPFVDFASELYAKRSMDFVSETTASNVKGHGVSHTTHYWDPLTYTYSKQGLLDHLEMWTLKYI